MSSIITIISIELKCEHKSNSSIYFFRLVWNKTYRFIPIEVLLWMSSVGRPNSDARTSSSVVELGDGRSDAFTENVGI